MAPQGCAAFAPVPEENKVTDWTEVVLRLVAALVGSMALGLNRDLHGKPTGMRTLGLVGLSSALVTLAAVGFGTSNASAEAASRVMQGVFQGVLTGVGFLGAGVILRDAPGLRVHGLTTAATVLVTAALGILFGLGQWLLAGCGLLLALAVLIAGGPIEHALRRWLKPFSDDADSDAEGQRDA
jgi:putative Mg2+ transporter-C (MgtC) family protein